VIFFKRCAICIAAKDRASAQHQGWKQTSHERVIAAILRQPKLAVAGVHHTCTLSAVADNGR
jgi:hypothetical protein